MPSSQGHSRENQFTDGMPVTAKRVILTRGTNAYTDAAVRGDDLEDDVEGREGDRGGFVVGGFGDADEEYGQCYPPDVVA